MGCWITEQKDGQKILRKYPVFWTATILNFSISPKVLSPSKFFYSKVIKTNEETLKWYKYVVTKYAKHFHEKSEDFEKMETWNPLNKYVRTKLLPDKI